MAMQIYLARLWPHQSLAKSNKLSIHHLTLLPIFPALLSVSFTHVTLRLHQIYLLENLA